MKEFDDFGKEISETVRLAVDSLPKDIGHTVRNAMGEFFDEDEDVRTEADTLERTFDVGQSAELSVSTVSGQITIRGADVPTITVRATKRGSRRRMDNTRIDLEHVGNRVSVRTRGDLAGRVSMRGNVCSVDYDIQAPLTCEVQAEGVSADISVRLITGNVGIKAVSGDIDIEHVTGDCSITTVSGDVTAGSLVGELHLRTTSGDATVRGSQLRRFNLNTVSGDLSIESPLTTGEHYLAKTVSGDLRLAVPPGTGATIQMKSVSGDVSTDLPAQIIKSTRRNWQGRINGGGANVEMHSVSGDLRVTLSTAQPPNFSSSPMPEEPEREEPASQPEPAPSPTAAETEAILQRLASGEISVEDAMAQLDAGEQ